jgi:hypothetical protein
MARCLKNRISKKFGFSSNVGMKKFYAIDCCDLNKYLNSTGWAKKVAFFIFWNPENYFSKNESSRSNFIGESIVRIPRA